MTDDDRQPNLSRPVPGPVAAEPAPSRGYVFYDGDCQLCSRSAERMRQSLLRRGYALMPLQSPEAESLSGLTREELLKELCLRTPAGEILRGVDAQLHLARGLPWARPLVALAYVPGVKPILRLAYRWLARRRRHI